MNLAALLEACDPDMKVVITNENGIGGAAYLAWPEDGWTAGQALDELAPGLFHVVAVYVKDDTLIIKADENPWCFGSYGEGGWYSCETRWYDVSIRGSASVREPDAQGALDMATQMLLNDEVAFNFEVREVDDGAQA